MYSPSIPVQPLDPSATMPHRSSISHAQSFADLQLPIPPLDAPPVTQLVTIGPLAQTLVDQVEQVGAAWFAVPPPIHHVAVSTGRGQHQSAWGQGTQPAGVFWTVNAPECTDGTAPATWLILDLWVEQTPALATAVIDQRITAARQQLQRLAVVACRQPAQPPPAIVLLVDPTRPADLERCRRRLAPLTTGPIYVFGVTAPAGSESAWQPQAATPLAALIWAQLPIPAVQDTPPSAGAAVYAVGAVAQPWPPHPVIRALSLLTTAAAVQRLLSPPAQPTTVAAADTAFVTLAALATQLVTDAQALAQQTALPRVRFRRRQPTWWRASAKPVAMLLAYTNLQQRPQQQAAGAARTAWLAAQLVLWDAAWQRARQLTIIPDGTTATALQDLTALEALQRHLLTLSQELDAAAATLATVLQSHEAQTEAAAQALTTFCADLPTLSLAGIWHFCRQPKQWPRWFWQLSVGLPRRLRRLSHCVTQQQKSVNTEANLHLRRQFALALLQDVAQELAWRRDLHTQLTALAADLKQQLAAAVAQLPAPWDRAQVERLQQELIRTDSLAPHQGLQHLTALLQQPTAPESGAAEWGEGTSEGIGESLVAHFAAAFAPLSAWSIATWLRAAFPAAGQSAPQAQVKGRWAKWRNGVHAPAPSAVEAWLATLAQQATPLWPCADATTAEPTEVLLVLPTLPAEALPVAPSLTEVAPHPDLAIWVTAQPNRAWLPRPLQAIVLVQRVSLP